MLSPDDFAFVSLVVLQDQVLVLVSETQADCSCHSRQDMVKSKWHTAKDTASHNCTTTDTQLDLYVSHVTAIVLDQKYMLVGQQEEEVVKQRAFELWDSCLVWELT
jgi:hypothetical protein